MSQLYPHPPDVVKELNEALHCSDQDTVEVDTDSLNELVRFLQSDPAMDSLDENQELIGAFDTLLDETADQSNYTPPTPRLKLLLTTNYLSLQNEGSYNLHAGGTGTIAAVDRDEVTFSRELDPKHREVTQAEEELVCLENDPDSTVHVASHHTYRRVDDARTVTWIDHHDDDSATLFEAVPAITGRLDDVSEHSEQIFDTVDDLYGRLSGMDRFDGPKSDADTLKRELDEHLATSSYNPY